MAVRNFTSVGKKIVAIGRNYVAHAKELNNPLPAKPFFFLKPTTSYLLQPNPIVLPYPGIIIHHEVELGIIIGKKGKDIPEKDALDYVGGYTIALDLTARQEQDDAKNARLPWTIAKGYDGFCPVGDFIPKEKIPDPQDIVVKLTVNGVVKQNESTKLMITKIPEMISFISRIMTLEPNDLILTGTPAGVGPIAEGDELVISIPNISEATFKVVAK
eukprot:TRINITY_DN2982_c0_g1_i1.p1 TRINITY_DN2982_c0_g1~~TRINITY_DN2982_c0_g1_i1.p1  ORF type:complete len:246 (-),score=53.37 TRINITY_DN2982_c0_g1_i1:143-790(-)